MAEKILLKLAKWKTSEFKQCYVHVCMVCPQCLLNSHTVTALKSVLIKHSTTVNMFNHNKNNWTWLTWACCTATITASYTKDVLKSGCLSCNGTKNNTVRIWQCENTKMKHKCFFALTHNPKHIKKVIKQCQTKSLRTMWLVGGV